MVQLERERESARESDRKRDYKLTYSQGENDRERYTDIEKGRERDR